MDETLALVVDILPEECFMTDLFLDFWFCFVFGLFVCCCCCCCCCFLISLHNTYFCFIFQRKCDQYWPERGTKSYGPIQVTLKETLNMSHYTVRKMLMTHKQVLELFVARTEMM